MSDQIVLKHVDDQAGNEDYKFVLRVFDGQTYFITAIDDLEITENGVFMVGTRNGEVIVKFSAALDFSMSARTDFKTRSRLELYEEELEIQVEANKFGENAKRILGIKDQPTGGYQE